MVQLFIKACLLHVVEEATKAWISLNPILFSREESKSLDCRFLLDVGRGYKLPRAHTRGVTPAFLHHVKIH
jgi:hypothetical protein